MPDIFPRLLPSGAEQDQDPEIMRNHAQVAGRRESIPVLDFLSRAPVLRFSMSFLEDPLQERRSDLIPPFFRTPSVPGDPECPTYQNFSTEHLPHQNTSPGHHTPLRRGKPMK